MTVQQVRCKTVMPEPDGKMAAKQLPAAAERALAEAEDRRKKRAKQTKDREIGGREGPEPTRFGDWEKDGIASDF